MGLAEVLAAAAAGNPPTPDGGVVVLPRSAGGAVAGVVGFTAHHVITADVDPGWVRSVLPPGSLSAPMSARFLAALADRVGAEPGAYDTVLVAPPRTPPAPPTSPELSTPPGPAHPAARVDRPDRAGVAGIVLEPVVAAESARLRRAERYRVDVRAWTVPGAILILGRGLAGRWEVSLEVDPAHRGRGLGRALVTAAGGLVPPGEPLWAQVSPANVASLRMFLSAGYRPVAAEVLFA
ncbi:MAG TPA: GNAT family N-acetyltransferase [Mycobacteriales bacterium]|nr:GNAT family N-acetyltransferase [Mycobacteriales bacterium]